jgi:hypothetical protein
MKGVGDEAILAQSPSTGMVLGTQGLSCQGVGCVVLVVEISVSRRVADTGSRPFQRVSGKQRGRGTRRESFGERRVL